MGDNLTSLHAETSEAKLQDRTDDSTFARLTTRGPRKDGAPGRVTEEGTGLPLQAGSVSKSAEISFRRIIGTYF